jgi:phenylalanine-4-hydroxylase
MNAAVNTYNNSKVRAGQAISNTRVHVVGLYNYIHDKYQKEIEKRATDKGKTAQEDKRKKVLKFFTDHDQAEIIKIFDLVNLLAAAKQMIVNKMNEAGHINTFLRTTTGFKVTGVEGFVAVDHLTGGAVKIVDRMEFSKSNFSPDIIKGWQR